MEYDGTHAQQSPTAPYDSTYTQQSSAASTSQGRRTSFSENWQKVAEAATSVKQSLGDVVLLAQLQGAKEFDSFSYRNGAFDNGLDICKASAVDPALDGDVTGTWLLTEIDHWDHEREKLLMLTDNCLLIIKFDFIALKVKDVRRVYLHMISQVQIGQLTYPASSFMKQRDHGGVRVGWGDPSKLTFGQKWNPLTRDIPYTTFSHHKLIYNEKERETATFNVDDFYESLKTSITGALKNKNPSTTLSVLEAPILISSYASLTSLVFNQSHLGYNRDRNGVAF